ncbi:MAG: hypothetical protein M1826_002737 [Phylliscum demangeonii]|nr:MAG: hypothetical protein M1826_002737 [Phylliscum demangeonii]
MHSSLVRAQNVFGLFTTVLFIISGLIATTSVVVMLPGVAPPPTASINFTPLFNWNTKQLFVYVLARWPGSNSSISSATDPITGAPPGHASSSPSAMRYHEAIIWDSILPSTAFLASTSHLITLSTIFPFSLLPARLFQFDRASTPFAPPSYHKKAPRSTSSTTTKNDLDQPGLLALRNAKPKYQITDLSGSIAGRANVTLHVRWNVQPWVGALRWSAVPGPDAADPSPRSRWSWSGMGKSAGASVDGNGVSEQFVFPVLKQPQQSQR